MQDLRDRLIRIESELGSMRKDMESLARRDGEHENAVKELTSEMRVGMEAQACEFRAALKEQADAYSKALEKVSDSFVKKDEWAFWKGLLQWAVIGLVGYAVASFRSPGAPR